MNNYQPTMSFDEEAASKYDQNTQRGDEAEAVAFLQALARGGPAMELAIGTGRIALPLAAAGVEVEGIDISPAMIARLRAKQGGEKLKVVTGNFADLSVEGSYRLIYVVFNTFFNLVTQEEQVRCFVNVARHLSADGLFVIEGGTPAGLYRLRNYQYVDAEAIETDHLKLDVARYDPLSQLLVETHVTLSPAGIQLNPIVTRYAWPAELDLMARIAGLRLRERWGTWSRAPFKVESENCISVYGW
jgi:SAM-dependent methyltransferase